MPVPPMKRRHFVFSAASFALLAGCGALPNFSNPSRSRLVRIGYLSEESPNDPDVTTAFAWTKQALADLGYVEGKNVVYERRDADSDIERLPELANELVHVPVDVIIIWKSLPAIAAARETTTVIPIVFELVGSPESEVELGVVPSLAHPGGNITGSSGLPYSLDTKNLQMLAQFVPGLSRVAIVLNTSSTPSQKIRLRIDSDAANAIGAQLLPLDLQTPDEVEPALAEALAWGAQAMIDYYSVGPPADATPRLIEFELQNRIPIASQSPMVVQAGALLGWNTGVSAPSEYPLIVARQVDKILKGANPGDVPVEEPSRWDLLVNRTTAQQLGLAIPPEIAQQVAKWYT